jgi:hypothetical protein
MVAGIALFKKDAWARKALPWFVGLCLAVGALGFIGCDSDSGGDDEWVDDNKLNTNLIGKWHANFEGGYSDTYTITANTISHPQAYPAYADAEIIFVYNFNESKTMGGIIIKRKETDFQAKPFLAVWFNDLKSKESVRLGDAYDTTKNWETESTDASVATLDEAKERFNLANAPTYGGASGNGGSPLPWVNP